MSAPSARARAKPYIVFDGTSSSPPWCAWCRKRAVDQEKGAGAARGARTEVRAAAPPGAAAPTGTPVAPAGAASPAVSSATDTATPLLHRPARPADPFPDIVLLDRPPPGAVDI
ncbi:unannotated protein [freshwater metagenome]|uniref:Unannotated protein n=1 Tax=freshwater metagenome TaxID=449393 RepID=A0A6J7L1F3_9ZZZZ